MGVILALFLMSAVAVGGLMIAPKVEAYLEKITKDNKLVEFLIYTGTLTIFLYLFTKAASK